VSIPDKKSRCSVVVGVSNLYLSDMGEDMLFVGVGGLELSLVLGVSNVRSLCGRGRLEWSPLLYRCIALLDI
jgi:hypothetical protein